MRFPGGRFRVEAAIVVVATILLSCLDAAYYTAFMQNWAGKPKRGLAAWQNYSDPLFSRSDCIFCISFQNIACLAAVVLSLWAARRFARRRFGGVIVLLLLVVPTLALSILPLIPMLSAIISKPAHDG